MHSRQFCCCFCCLLNWPGRVQAQHDCKFICDNLPSHKGSIRSPRPPGAKEIHSERKAWTLPGHQNKHGFWLGHKSLLDRQVSSTWKNLSANPWQNHWQKSWQNPWHIFSLTPIWGIILGTNLGTNLGIFLGKHSAWLDPELRSLAQTLA